MSSWWKWVASFYNSSIPKENLVTLTFDTKTRNCESNVLSERIRDHGGGMTNIPDAFKLLEEFLFKIPHDHNVTIIFISDG